MSRWEPDAAWLDARFDRAIKSTIFRGERPEAGPVVVLLGGQPGAGKSRAAQFVQDLHGTSFAVINGDDFRALHPEFKRLQRDDPESMPTVTQAVSGPLVARAIDYAKDQRVSVLVEGTFRDPAMVLETARAFQAVGFTVHAVALAVPPEVSRASTLGRFYETLGTDQNRWTPPAAHEAAVRGMPVTVGMLAGSPAVDRFTILDRDGAVLEDSTEPGPGRARQMRQSIEETYRRPLTGQERALVEAAAARVHEVTRRRHEPGVAAAAKAARAAFGRPATEATRSRPQVPKAGPQRPPPSTLSDRAPGIGD